MTELLGQQDLCADSEPKDDYDATEGALGSSITQLAQAQSPQQWWVWWQSGAEPALWGAVAQWPWRGMPHLA